ncbi:MAG TPA: hypothetical protein VKX46_15675, partial [Ktedonobacteraceae bacterium]|nr:hypothetical protein [Ktedonobacteraceae bacterium]
EWLCGTPPFQGRPATIMEMHRHAPPPPLTNKRTRIPPAVASVVLMALEKNPQQRFPTVNTFAHALEQAYTHASSSW